MVALAVDFLFVFVFVAAGDDAALLAVECGF